MSRQLIQKKGQLPRIGPVITRANAHSALDALFNCAADRGDRIENIALVITKRTRQMERITIFDVYAEDRVGMAGALDVAALKQRIIALGYDEPESDDGKEA